MSLLPNRVVASAFLAFAVLFFPRPASGVIRDGGIDPTNLGRGSWIWLMPTALNQLGGHVSSVTNLPTLMTFMKNQGLQYVIIKAAQSNTVFTVGGTTNFTSEIVKAGHAAGLKVYGYIYTTGSDIPGEIAMADYIFEQGADGLIYDAEIEWETNAPTYAARAALATNLCSTVRSNWPNKFMGLSTWPYRASHAGLPYKEFAYYCDVIMPQVYWIELEDTPTEAVTRMNSEWKSWTNSLTGIWTNAIKPFVGTGQGWNSANGTNVTTAMITEFESALKAVSSPASPGGYKNVDYWRAELHPMSIWNAIRTNFMANSYTNAPVIEFVPAAAVSAATATISWPTDQKSDGVVEFGLTTGYGTSITNTNVVWYHSVELTGLSPDTTYHFRVKSKGTNNLTSVSADYVFTTTVASVSDIIIDQDNANNAGGSTCTLAGGWTASSGAAYLGTFQFASPNYSLGSPTRTAKFTPNITTSGSYDIYASWASSATNGNRATNAPFRVYHNGGAATNRVNEEANGNSFQLIFSGKSFSAGTTGYVEAGNDVTMGVGGDIVIADAVKLVYVPPPPSAPSISTHPQNQIVNQGSTTTFTVVAAGTATLNYQWQRNDTNLPGATASMYVKNNTQPADAGNYSVIITNIAGSTNSNIATLTVNLPPTITLQPLSRTNAVGTVATFWVEASGTAPLSYQWRKGGEPLSDGGDVSGATTATLTLADVTESDAANYTVVITNVAGQATSVEAGLTVIGAPVITEQPESRVNNLGTLATFSVTATGSGPLSYQWRKGDVDLSDGESISGAGSGMLSVSGVTLGDAGDYSVVVMNAAGSVTSAVAVLTVMGSSDITAPSVSVTVPANGGHVGIGVVTLMGTAKDTSPGVIVGVKYRQWPETEFTSALIWSDGVRTNWSAANVVLAPGTNIVHAYSVDAGGNESPIKTNKFYYDVPGTLTVKIDGNGQVKNAALGLITNDQKIPILVGRPYGLTALVGLGTNYVFTNWTAATNLAELGEVTNGLAYNFVVPATNWIARANFITNPFTPVAGVYAGLFMPASGVVDHRHSGFIKVTVTGKASYSCSVIFDGDKISGGGKFNLSGQTSRVYLRDKKGKGPVTMELALDWSTESQELHGTLTDGEWVSEIVADRSIYNANHLAPMGRSTFVLPRPENHPADAPGGYGYGVVSNTPLGQVKITAGGMGDGSKLSQSVTISKDGRWPLYAQFYKTTNFNLPVINKVDYRGSLMGWVTFTNGAPGGELSWIKTDGAPTYMYPDGFTSVLGLVSSVYAPPLAGQRAMEIVTGTITFSHGNLTTPVAYNVNWATNNVITVAGAVTVKPTFALSAKTGLLKGYLPHPQMGNAKTNYAGVILQNEDKIRGHFKGPDQSGSFTLQP